MGERSAPVLQARGLSKYYKELKAVDSVDLTLARGECLALLGPNGAGKTTTVEMLEGLTAPDAGTVEMLGSSLHHHRRDLMARVGVVLQDTQLYKRFTVEETLTLFASFFPVSLPPNEVMARLSLTDKRRTQLRHLSGGQKQRAYLGCALINNPELLFLDEPTTGLDPQARHALWDLIHDLKREGKSVLLTTHYMEEAETLADRVAVMDKGRIIASGTPRSLIREHCGEQILWLEFADSQTNTASIAWLKNAVPTHGGYEIYVENAAEEARVIFARAQTDGINIKRLEIRKSTLEDVFLKITGRSIRDD